MNQLDVVILVVIGLSALLGAIRGMLTEVLSLVVWVAAIALTVAFGESMATMFTGIATPLLRDLAGYGATFALVVIVGNLLVWLLRTILHGMGLSGTDRLFGAGFGALRGYAVVLVVVLVVGFTPWSQGALWRQSSLMPLFSAPSGWIVAKLPDSSVLVAAAGSAVRRAGDAVEAHVPAVDPALAAQWSGLGEANLAQLAGVQAFLAPGTPRGTASAGDPARVGAAPHDPARVTTDPEAGDPADIHHASPESR